MRLRLVGLFALGTALVAPAAARAQALLVDGTTVTLGGRHVYTSVSVINGGRVAVTPYDGTDKVNTGNLILVAPTITVDATSRIDGTGAGYQPVKCGDGPGPSATAGGRGGCSVRDSGGGGGHFGAGGRGTKDCFIFGSTTSCQFPEEYEENCGNTLAADGLSCTSTSECRNNDGLPTVAGQPFRHNIYDSEFGAAGGDKGCRDGDGFGSNPVTAGSGGGRVVLVALNAGQTGAVTIQGQVLANGTRGCGNGNDSAGGGAGGSILIIGDTVTVGGAATIAAAGGLGGDTTGGASCPAPAQQGGTCDDCGGGGGGGVVSVLSRTASYAYTANFNVDGALGGTCTICQGEAGGGAGELQLTGGWTGEVCDGYDNDYDGTADNGIPDLPCGIPACVGGRPQQCPTTPACVGPVTDTRPRFAVVMDSSGSMLTDLTGRPTFGDGSVGHPGLDVDGNGAADDSKLSIAKRALTNVIAAYPEVDFALGRYHQDQGVGRSCQLAHWFECHDLCCSYDDPRENVAPAPVPACTVDGGAAGASIEVLTSSTDGRECINYAGSCGPPERGADFLVGFGAPIRQYLMWLDGTEGPFVNTTPEGNYCDFAGGGDCEVRGTGPTPLAGSLDAARAFLTPIRGCDAAATGGCRKYGVILLSDGAESCLGNPVTSATNLWGDGVETFVIGFSVQPTEVAELNAIAMAGSGGARGAFLVGSESELANALAQIVGDAVKFEICNGVDDDCDGLVDEGFQKYCDVPGGVATASLCADPGDPCDGVDDNCFDGTDDEIANACGACGPTPTEICNAVDDDCDGLTDEGGLCGGCVPQAEVCDGEDNDCDGEVDEMLTRACGTDVGACEVGVEMCELGAWIGCTATTGTAETCNGVDDDCDGVIDGMAESCGPPDTGECQPGSRVCNAGTWGTCTGGIGPAGEICDGLDNDCDGTPDDGAAGTGVPCSTSCGAGATACVDGALVCVGGGAAETEVCDGFDNDCDGRTDEDQPSMGACTEGGALCVPGEMLCAEGRYQCIGGSAPGAERCDCVDNDCDELVDEGELCGPDATCLGGDVCGCVRRCAAEEFPCPLGFVCTTPDDPASGYCVPDRCAGVPCPDENGVARVCVDGACVDACDTVTCTAPFLCRPSDGVCVPDSCTYFPERCGAEEVCVGDVCVNDPCALVSCGTQACDDGTCVDSCAGVRCDVGTSCDHGVCVADVCGGVFCEDGEACDPASGRCERDFCGPVVCRAGERCVPGTGECEPDPCALVDCPSGQVCEDGDCYLPSDLVPPVMPEWVSATGGGGFTCAIAAPGARGGGAGAGWLVVVLAGVGVVVVRASTARRLRRRALGTIGVVVVAIGLSGCQIDGSCVTCALNGDGGEGGDGSGFDDAIVELDAFLTDGCIPSGVEICDGIDNDCDVAIDEGTLPDVGVVCGSDEGACEPGRTECVDGVLVCGGGAIPASAEACDGVDNDCDGVIDDGDPGGGFPCGVSVGECVPGTTRCVDGAVACVGGRSALSELCNGRDDDCDGVIDDGNPEGGGPCGVAAGTCAPGVERCSGGSLVCDGAGIPAIESCDGFDNDCDSMTDEDFDLTSDVRHCGGCGNACAGTLLHAHATCEASRCVIASCDTGWFDLDRDDDAGDVLGCEYACDLRGVEICNGVDDDCDGQIDEGLTPPAICAQLGACAGTVARCDGDEGWVCPYPAPVATDLLGGILPDTACDGVDGDCNGGLEDGFPELGQPCDDGRLGACKDPGVRVCDPDDASRTACDVAAPPGPLSASPTAELCNDVDDDCNGTVDDATGTGRVIDDMVEVNRGGLHFWIYRHEASRPDATASVGGVVGARACGRAGVVPWTQLTYAAAGAACAAAGKRLCTGAEWGEACGGAGDDVYPYGDTFAADACNGEEHDGAAAAGDQDVVLATGAQAMCHGADQIFDLSGNVKEWTQDVRGTTGPPENQSIVVLRGGAYDTPAPGLTCAFDLSRAPASYVAPTVGFRCCSSTAP